MVKRNKNEFKNTSLSFFKQVEVPPFCSLHEALYWIAFKKPPETFYPINPEERRDMGHDEEIELHPAFDIELILDDKMAKKYNITPNPDLELYNNNDSPPISKNFILDSIKKWKEELKKENIQDKTKEQIKFTKSLLKSYEDDFIKYKEYYDKRDKFEYELNSLLELSKSKLFTLLKEGNISSMGLLFATIKEDISPYGVDLEDEENWNEDEDCFREEMTEINPNFWSFDKIKWDYSYAQSIKEWYIQILLPTYKLMELFPLEMSECKLEKVYSNNGFLLTDKKTEYLKSYNKQGRPSKKWDEIYRKAFEILSDNNFNSNQNYVILDIQEWYKNEFGEHIGESTLKEKIKPLFKIYKSQKTKEK